jgi:hypothetical protein
MLQTSNCAARDRVGLILIFPNVHKTHTYNFQFISSAPAVVEDCLPHVNSPSRGARPQVLPLKQPVLPLE